MTKPELRKPGFSQRFYRQHILQTGREKEKADGGGETVAENPRRRLPGL